MDEGVVPYWKDYKVMYKKILSRRKIKYAAAHISFPQACFPRHQAIFLYWAKLVFRVTRLQLPAGLVIPVNQVIS